MAMRKRTKRVLLSLLGAWLALSAAGLIFRDPIASYAAAKVMASKGFECNAVSVHVPLRLPPSPVVLEPAQCGVKEGPLESIEFKSPVRVVLHGAGIEIIRVASLSLDLRVRGQPDVEMNTLGDVTKLLGADHPAIELMIDTAVLSKEKSPPVLAEEVKVTRGGEPVAELHEMRVVSTSEGVVVTSPRAHISQAAPLGEGSLRVEASSTTARANVVFLNKLKVKLVVDHIGAAKPTANFDISLDGIQQAPPADKARDDKKVEQKKEEKKAEEQKAGAKKDANKKLAQERSDEARQAAR